jgi:hypothetical protein
MGGILPRLGLLSCTYRGFWREAKPETATPDGMDKTAR